VPNKLFGVVAMIFSLVLLFLLPLLTSRIKFNRHYPVALTVLDAFFYLLLFVFIILGYLGSMPAEAPYVIMSQCFTFLYFFSFVLVCMCRRPLFLILTKKFIEEI